MLTVGTSSALGLLYIQNNVFALRNTQNQVCLFFFFIWLDRYRVLMKCEKVCL